MIKDYKLKILLFSLFVIVLIVLLKNVEGYSNGTRTTEYAIHILSKEKGKEVFNRYKDVSNYNNREISARSKFKIHLKSEIKKIEMKDTYIENIMDFTSDEKQSIIDSINYLFQNFKDQVPLIKTWNFIKLNKDIDWGYPFTINDYIVLPSERISMDPKVLARTLFHEQLHIIQRREPNIFKNFFEQQWGFESFNLPDDPWINKYLVRNPDSDDFYKYKLSEELYLVPLPTTHDKHYRFVEVALFLNEKGSILAKGAMPYVVPLRQVVEYNERFYNADSLYHPNEIFATILTDMVFNDLSVKEKDQIAFNAIFKQLKDYF